MWRAAAPVRMPPREKDCCRIKERSEEEYKCLVNRLNRIERQIGASKGFVALLSLKDITALCLKCYLPGRNRPKN